MEDWGGKLARSINEKSSNLNGKLKMKIDDCWGKKIDKEIVNEKSPNLGGDSRKKSDAW